MSCSLYPDSSTAARQFNKEGSMNWYIPDIQPYISYALHEISRWFDTNFQAIAIVVVILGVLRAQAKKLEAVKDNTVLSMTGYYLDMLAGFCMYVLKGSWLTQFRNAAKGNISKSDAPSQGPG